MAANADKWCIRKWGGWVREEKKKKKWGLGLVKHTQRRAMIMSFVCVAHFIFIANDKPSGAELMTNTSTMLIETISLVRRREPALGFLVPCMCILEWSRQRCILQRGGHDTVP